MQKVVINSCHGGFCLSKQAQERLRELGVDCLVIERTDPRLVQVVQELGEAADGEHARLKVVEIPDGVEWRLEEFDGLEWVAEKHRTWG